MITLNEERQAVLIEKLRTKIEKLTSALETITIKLDHLPGELDRAGLDGMANKVASASNVAYQACKDIDHRPPV
jgi:hypothetical protein